MVAVGKPGRLGSDGVLSVLTQLAAHRKPRSQARAVVVQTSTQHRPFVDFTPSLLPCRLATTPIMTVAANRLASQSSSFFFGDTPSHAVITPTAPR